MISYLEFERVNNNIREFIEYVSYNIEPITNIGNNTRISYFECLNRVQRHKFHFLPDSISIQFDLKDSINNDTLKHFMELPTINHNLQFSFEKSIIIKKNVEEASSFLYNYDPSVWKTIHMLVGSVLFAQPTHSVSASFGDTLGVIWLSPPNNWKIEDYAEHILHEGVHQALFLEEMIHRIFVTDPNALADADALITSAILKIKRGYDLAFHSAAVSCSLIDFYLRTNNFHKAYTFYDTLPITLQELRSKDKFLTSHGKIALREMEDFIKIIEKDKSIHSL